MVHAMCTKLCADDPGLLAAMAQSTSQAPAAVVVNNVTPGGATSVEAVNQVIENLKIPEPNVLPTSKKSKKAEIAYHLAQAKQLQEQLELEHAQADLESDDSSDAADSPPLTTKENLGSNSGTASPRIAKKSPALFGRVNEHVPGLSSDTQEEEDATRASKSPVLGAS